MSEWRIGHRGACGHAPENTRESIRKALEFDVHGFEFDIQLSSDGVPMVIHDATLDGTTNGKGLVSSYSAEELGAFTTQNGEKIPTLRDVLELVDKRSRLFIELKAEGAEVPVAAILSEYVQHYGWSFEQFFVCSFDHLQIAAIRAINPDIRTVALLVGIPVSLAAIAADAGAWALATALDHTSHALVEDAHKRGLKLFLWTVNDPIDIMRARALNADGIISDYPDRL